MTVTDIQPAVLPQQYLSSPTGGLPPVPVLSPEPRYFTEAQVEAIRQQEKDKLYERLEKTNTQLSEFKSVVDQLKADKDARDAELEATKQKSAAETKRIEQEKLTEIQRLEQRQLELENQQQQRLQDMELKLTIAAKEQELLRLKSYIQRRVNEEVNALTIIPELVEYINGATEEEVEASIAKAKVNSESIINGAQSLTGSSIPMGTSPTGAPYSPLDNLSPANREPTLEQLRGMDMEQYQTYRKARGIDRAGSGRGLFS